LHNYRWHVKNHIFILQWTNLSLRYENSYVTKIQTTDLQWCLKHQQKTTSYKKKWIPPEKETAFLMNCSCHRNWIKVVLLAGPFTVRPCSKKKSSANGTVIV
jgi:hypothetical protein